MQKKKKRKKSLKRPIKNKRWDKIKAVIKMAIIEVAVYLIKSIFEDILIKSIFEDFLQMVFQYLF